MKIHVGNLSNDISEEDLRLALEKIGKVESIEIMKEKYNDLTKVFAYIEMDSEECGQSAIENLNGKELKGRILKVSKALAKTEGPGGKRRFSGGRGGHGQSKGVPTGGKGGSGGGRGGFSGGKGGFGGKKGFSGGRGGRGR
ncbi:MAG: RNA recognition motif domain-containing protein [Planctomycetota bacterium]|jgi:RNA recognition motif-containing protein